MTDSNQIPQADDAEGHGRYIADAERDESDDAEGHGHGTWSRSAALAEGEQDKSDETEGQPRSANAR